MDLMLGGGGTRPLRATVLFQFLHCLIQICDCHALAVWCEPTLLQHQWIKRCDFGTTDIATAVHRSYQHNRRAEARTVLEAKHVQNWNIASFGIQQTPIRRFEAITIRRVHDVWIVRIATETTAANQVYLDTLGSVYVAQSATATTAANQVYLDTPGSYCEKL